MIDSRLMNWELLANTLAILAAGNWLIVYLAKLLSSHLLAWDLERFKSDIKTTHDHALEQLRADLRIQAFERETIFSRLHDKRIQPQFHCARYPILCDNPTRIDAAETI